MPLWNITDREESKPTWLSAFQKRFCIRTISGWELPTQYADNAVHSSDFSGSDGAIPTHEVLVAIPLDPSVTGVTATYYAGRTVYAAGITASGETAGNNYVPYVSTPFNGDSATAGGPEGTGVSHDSWKNTLPVGTRLNRFNVSSLWIPYGITNYVKVLGADPNYTNDLTLSFLGTSLTGVTANDVRSYTGSSLFNTALVPLNVFESFFGATAYGTNGLGVLVFGSGVTTGNYGITATVNDGYTAASSFFRVTVG